MSDNKHNDPLEQFFRKKAKEYDIQYKEEDWLKLEERLDSHDKQSTDRNWRYMAAAAVLILFSVLAFITYQQQQKINQLNERLSEAENTTNIPNPIQEISPEEPAKSSENSDNSQRPPEQNDNLTTNTQPPVIADDEPNQKQEGSSIDRNAERTFAREENQQSIPLASITERNLVVTSAKTSPGVDGRSPAISAIKPLEFNAKRTTMEKPEEYTPSSTPKNALALQRSPKFSVGLLAGPDLSTVGGVSNFYDPGHKLGLILEYNINQNFAISVGALRSNVRYTASGNEYQPPQDYWTYNTAPDQTVAQCILIDIPISLKYNVLHFKESRVYATAGVSSYIMLDEEYRFNYDYNQPGLRQEWHERTGTRHWMSNATLSIGYELDVMRNMSIRAEPFLKVPLREVGWGNVKLYSVGSFISLNYNIY